MSCHRYHFDRPLTDEEFERVFAEMLGETTRPDLPETRPLDEALRTRAHVRLLRALTLLGDDVTVTGRDAARRAGVSHARAVEVLRDLRRLGVIKAHRGASWAIYELDDDSPLVAPLRALFEAERDLTPA